MTKWMVLSVVALVSLTPGIALSKSDSPTPVIAEKTSSNYSGNWTARWLSNDSRNPMQLTQNTTKFTGQYINDSKDNCAVAGNLEPENQFIKLQINCPKWNIQMEGFPSLDGKLIVGEYLAYGKAVGGFILSKD